MKVAATLVAAVVLSFAGLFAQQPARDAAPVPIQGTAILAGVVLIDGPDVRPARGAVVTLNHTDKLHGDTAVTDEQGRFDFRGIPAGRYLLGAEKDSYLRARYGATRPGRAGTPIAITNGQRMADVTLRLVRGAVITGTVRNTDGEPAPGVDVVVTRMVMTGGKPRLVDAHMEGDSRTDDRGVYRRYGLGEGDYVIHADPRQYDHGGSLGGANPTTSADIAWARAMLTAPGSTGQTTRAPTPAAGTLSYAPVYFPSTLQRSAATVVTLGAGEERAGIDLTLQLISTYRVSGTVRMPDGSTPAKPPDVFLAELGGASGWFGVKESSGAQFSFEGVAPGAYAVAAIDEQSKMWAISNLNVGNSDQTVSLTLQPALAATGQLVFRGTQPSPTDLKLVSVYTEAVIVGGGLAVQPSMATAKADGTFTIEGLVPGSYRVGAALPGGDARAGTGWVMRSAMVGDQDIADVPLEVRSGVDMGRIVVTFTDRHTELTGRLQDASGRAASDYFIIVFSPDERTWYGHSRRIAQTRPASDGQFIVRGLPPGDYLIAALTDVERDEWFDTGFLRELVGASIKISLGEGEKKVQDIRVK